MVSPIAKIELIAVSPDGSRFSIDIEVGTPYKDPKYERAWRCPISMKGLHNRLPDLGGGDSFHALCIVMNFVRRQLEHLQIDGVRLLTVENGKESDFPLDAYFPSE
jgi:uncharacterized protein DUF6968